MKNQHKLEFEAVLFKLRAWREKVIEELRSPETQTAALELKRQLDGAIGCLELCQLHQIRPKSQVTVLPDTQTRTPSSTFRVLEDHETEERTCWTEVEIGGAPLTLSAGDLILS